MMGKQKVSKMKEQKAKCKGILLHKLKNCIPIKKRKRNYTFYFAFNKIKLTPRRMELFIYHNSQHGCKQEIEPKKCYIGRSKFMTTQQQLFSFLGLITY